MSSDAGQDGTRSTLATIGIVLLPVLCCGLPVLIVSGALGGIGAALGNPWVIGAAVVLALLLLATRVRRHPRGSADGACCPPERPTGYGPGSSDHARTDKEF